MTQINNMTPEVMGFDIMRTITAPYRVTLDVDRKIADETIPRKKQVIKTNVAKIKGSNYAAILPFLNKAMKAFQSLPASAKAEMQPVYMNGINKARNAYIQNANTLMNLYRSFLSSSNPQEVTGAIQSYTLDMQSLIDSKHSTGSTKEVDNKDNEMRALLTSLQNYGENISSRQINLVEEQTRQQGRIIDYETGGTGNGLSLGKLLIPAALGVGAIMLLKG